jgi:hypothetical protein
VADQDKPSSVTEQGSWARPISKPLGETAMVVALLATAVFFIWQSALLSFGSIGLPGPAFFPFVLGIVLSLMAGAILFRVWLTTSSDDEPVLLGHRDVLVTMIALCGVALGFETDAYLVLGAFVAAMLLLVGRTTLKQAVLGAAVGMIAVWAVFKVALGVRLPTNEHIGRMFDLLTAWLPSNPP